MFVNKFVFAGSRGQKFISLNLNTTLALSEPFQDKYMIRDEIEDKI